MNRLIFWIFDHIGERDEIKSYEGHGNFSEERGWWVFKKWWVSYDKFWCNRDKIR